MSKTLLTPKEFIEGKGYKGLAAQTEICSWLEEYHNYCLSQSKVLPEDVERAIEIEAETRHPKVCRRDGIDGAYRSEFIEGAKWGYSLATDKSDGDKWTFLKDKEPTGYETGNWDGKKTDTLIVCDKNDRLYIAIAYVGHMDGGAFCDFYTLDDFEINDVVKWMPAPIK